MGIGNFAAKGAVGGWSSVWRNDGTKRTKCLQVARIPDGKLNRQAAKNAYVADVRIIAALSFVVRGERRVFKQTQGCGPMGLERWLFDLLTQCCALGYRVRGLQPRL